VTTELTVGVATIAAGGASLGIRWAVTKKPPTERDWIGIGVAAVGVASSVDLFFYAIDQETALTTGRALHLMAMAVIVFGAAIKEGVKIFASAGDAATAPAPRRETIPARRAP
jgi:uncharacterized membrane protein YczE